jgi:hypothetical protein
MATRDVKKIGKSEKTVQPAHNALEVMKPFFHFGLKATGLIANTLITIVKNIPKPNDHNNTGGKSDKIIKI